jgi:hypothetical protein
MLLRTVKLIKQSLRKRKWRKIKKKKMEIRMKKMNRGW